MKSLRTHDMKDLNRMSILLTIKEQVCSRTNVANYLGMSKPAVSALVDELQLEGLIYETGRGDSTESGGKRPILLDFNRNAGMFIAVYFNGEWYEIALTNLSGTVISSVKKSMLSQKDYRNTLNQMIEDISKIIEEVKKIHPQPILACGVSIKGLVDTKLGTLRYSATMPEWKEAPVGEYINNALGIPVYVENDARAATYLELLEKKEKLNAMACVTLGEGLGTGIAIQNEVYRGAFDGATTFAHTTILDGGPSCQCGNRGCWEVLASTTAFLKELEKRDSSYASISLESAIKKVREGDDIVIDTLINYTGYWLGVGIANMLNVFNPEEIILQGELTLAGEGLRKKIEEVAMQRTLPVSKKAKIKFSEHVQQYQVKGAASVVIKHFFSIKGHKEIWQQRLSIGGLINGI